MSTATKRASRTAAARRKIIRDYRQIADLLGIGPELAQAWIDRHLTMDQVREDIAAVLRKRSTKFPGIGGLLGNFVDLADFIRKNTGGGITISLTSEGAASTAPVATPAAMATPARFTKLDKEDRPLPDSAAAWDYVFDSKTQLIWPAELLPSEHTHEEALRKATERGAGWRAPEIGELLTVIDYTRHEPAVHTSFFRWKSMWVWSGTKAVAPAGYAWAVNLYYGYSSRDHQDGRGSALAVRVGQPLGLGK